MIIDELIFDRTQSDIINRTRKAYIDYEDLNRIESAVEYISNQLNVNGYINVVDAKTDWNIRDIRLQTECDRIRNNIIELKEKYYVKHTTPDIPTNIDWSSYIQANDIERILFDIADLIVSLNNNFVYCGVGGAGQDRIWQKRFRTSKSWTSQPHQLNQYASTDMVKMMATAQDKVVEGKTDILELSTFDRTDDVYASIEALNDNMEVLDTLAGDGTIIQYQELDYIESTGTQWLDTEVEGNQDVSLEMVVTPTSIANVTASGVGFIPYGSAVGYNNSAFECYSWNGMAQVNYDGQYTMLHPLVLNEKIRLKHNKNTIKIENLVGTTDTFEFVYTNFNTPYTIALFATNRGGMLIGNQKIYNCKIYSNDVLVRDLMPCYRKSDNVIGMYDKINKVFYTNKGTGTFVKGTEV